MRKLDLSYFLIRYMTDSTSINELPTDPTSGGTINPQPSINPTTEGSSMMALDNSTIQQIVNGIQKATSSGSTSLPSRDIPNSGEEITTDPHANIDYIPKNEKYELDQEEDEEIITNNYNNNQKNENIIEEYYEMFKIPILLAILFFIFQLPVIKQLILKNMQYLAKADGNFNLNGLIFYSLLFGSSYFLLNNFIIQ